MVWKTPVTFSSSVKTLDDASGKSSNAGKLLEDGAARKLDEYTTNSKTTHQPHTMTIDAFHNAHSQTPSKRMFGLIEKSESDDRRGCMQVKRGTFPHQA